MKNNFAAEQKQKYITRLRALQKELPGFLESFFRGTTASEHTRLAYAYDLGLFFKYITENKPDIGETDMHNLDVSVLSKIEPEDIEKYLEYLSYYTKEEDGFQFERQNDEYGKSRKLSAVRTMFAYYYKHRKISADPSALVDFPKIHSKVIIRLEADEVALLLDEVENGDKLTERQQKYHERNGNRDLAIVTLLLGTGMRVSECVGLNISDVDFNLNGMKITRKGGNEAIVYFGAEVETALKSYLSEREKIDALPGSEDALFLSLQRKRITARAVQNLVKKYAKIATPIKKITPHKLRSTFGTSLYRESRDIYLVADALGHADVNTTKKHYAQMEDERRREVVKYVKLREE